MSSMAAVSAWIDRVLLCHIRSVSIFLAHDAYDAWSVNVSVAVQLRDKVGLPTRDVRIG